MPQCAMPGCVKPVEPGSAFCAEGGPLTHGPVPAPALRCPRCGDGSVHSHATTQRRGIACWKAVGAVVTFGWSILAVGLTRRQRVTVCQCGVCGTRWTFD